MKKTIIILLIIIVVSFTTTAILLGVQFQNMNKLEEMETKAVSRIKDVSLSPKIKSIDIYSKILSDINIHSEEGDEIRVELIGEYTSLITKNIDIYVTETLNNLRFEVKERGIGRYVDFGNYKTDLTLNIYIPDAYREILNINAEHDNLYIEESIVNNLTIRNIDNFDEFIDILIMDI